MAGLNVTFDSPGYLGLLLFIPLLWIWSFRSLAGLGKIRRLMALALRTFVLAVIVLSLAEIQLVRTSEKLTVVYVLDQSASIPGPQRKEMLEYVVRDVKLHRNRGREDRAGVIVFGRDALIEIPPFDDDILNTGMLETTRDLRSDGTNLEAALKLAQASFSADSAKRIVLVTDGNENVGDARMMAHELSNAGIGIDVVPVRLSSRSEVSVDKVTLPTDIRRGQPFDATVVVNNHSTSESDERGGKVQGKLRVTRQIGRTEELVSEDEVELVPGKNVYRFQQKIDQPAVYTYKAAFTPADRSDDVQQENNEAAAFSHVRGKGRVLFIVDSKNAGEFDYLISRLAHMNIEVEVQPSDQLFTNLAELQAFDTVVLADVPRSSGEEGNDVSSFSDEQVQMLVLNTEKFGCGLVMLGGKNSYGAGGWNNSELEKAMPVDFQIKNAKIQASGAIVMLMHASEMPEGNHWQKVIAAKSVEMLGPMDYAGIIHWEDFAGDGDWLWGKNKGGLIQVQNQKKMMLAKINQMTPGDMMDFEPAMSKAIKAFQRNKASVKHMIIISDGDPAPPHTSTMNLFKKAGIPVSTVAIGTHGPAGSTPLQNIALQTGGKYYVVTDPKALPKIYQREVRKISRPLMKELDRVPPRMVYRHEMLQGIDEPLPPLTGFMMTTLKDNPLVEVSLRSPDPTDTENATILASWNYGLGRVVAFTPDTGRLEGGKAAGWAGEWINWPDYDKFFSQMIRWSMRPLGDQGKFTMVTNVKDGRVQVVITALDKNDEFLNFLNMSSAVISPDLDSAELKIEQVAPGRYTGEFDATKAGNYFVSVNPGQGQAPLLAGANVPYSAEFRDRDTNIGLLSSLAKFTPKNGKPGEVIEGELTRDNLQQLLKTDTFRHNLDKATSSQNVWPLVLVMASCVFFADVFVRRVSLSWEWLVPVWAWLRKHVLRRTPEAARDDRMVRLRGSKAAVSEQIDERRAAARFEPQVAENSATTPTKSLEEVMNENATAGPAATASAPPPASLAPGDAEAQSYTSRLLKVKQQARKDTKPPGET